MFGKHIHTQSDRFGAISSAFGSSLFPYNPYAIVSLSLSVSPSLSLSMDTVITAKRATRQWQSLALYITSLFDCRRRRRKLPLTQWQSFPSLSISLRFLPQRSAVLPAPQSEEHRTIPRARKRWAAFESRGRSR